MGKEASLGDHRIGVDVVEKETTVVCECSVNEGKRPDLELLVGDSLGGSLFPRPDAYCATQRRRTP